MDTIDPSVFANLHRPYRPLLLYNAWDVGSAHALVEAGATAIATSSWSVAAAQGYADGQQLPFDMLLRIVTQIRKRVEVPVSVDVEGGYADDLPGIVRNIEAIHATGAVGINFEDQVIGGAALHSVQEQAKRIRAIRQAVGEGLFINARTDIFFQAPGRSNPQDHMAEAIVRAKAYAEAGADGFFVPGLVEFAQIEGLCRESPLPVNVMLVDGSATIAEVAGLGVARVSHGPAPYLAMMEQLTSSYRSLLAQWELSAPDQASV